MQFAGPKAPKDMNTFHKKLVEEMKVLSRGVRVYDAYRHEIFTLKGTIINYSLDWQAHCKCFFQMGATSYAPCPFCTLQGNILYDNMLTNR